MTDFITLECPSCGGRTDFSPADDLFVCAYCGNKHVFRLPTRGNIEAGARSQEPLEKTRQRAMVPRPQQVTVRKHGQSLELSWRWFSAKFIGLAFFCLFWDGFLCLWYSLSLGFATQAGAASLIMVLFPLLHVAVGVSLTYYTLTGFLNSSTLQVNRRAFSVRHGPLPWFGQADVPVAELKQLYCKEKISRSSDGDSVSYQLSAVLENGRKLDLVSNLDSPEIGFFIEQQIENWLRLPDQPVRGEIPRSK